MLASLTDALPHRLHKSRTLLSDIRRSNTLTDGRVVEYTTYEVVKEEAEVVRRVFRMYAEGASYKTVAHTLNEEGITSPGGSTWDPSSVRTVLLNENYRGRRVWNQTRRNKKVQRGSKVPKPRKDWVIAENAHEAIVDDELWGAVQRRRRQVSQHIRAGGARRILHTRHLLTGLLKCDECGGNFIMSSRRRNGRTNGRYRCSHHSNRGSAVCANSRVVGQNLIEGAVLDAVSEELLTKDVIEAVIEECKAQAEQEVLPEAGRLTELQREIGRFEKEIANLTLAIRAGGPIEELVADLKGRKARKRDLEQEVEEIESSEVVDLADVGWEDVEDGIRNLRDTLKEATVQEKRDLLQENISMIRVPRKGNALLEANPAGLFQHAGVLLNGDPEGSRTPVSRVRIWCPRPLNDGVTQNRY